MKNQDIPIKERIRTRLIELRSSKHLPQHEVAEALGMKQNKYCHYETGVACPKLETILSIVKYYGLSSIDELIFG